MRNLNHVPDSKGFKPLVRLIVVAGLLMLTTLYTGAQDGTPEPAQLITRVLLITLDGARPDAILQADAPNLRALAERGAVDWAAQTVMPPVTLPAHATIYTGVDSGWSDLLHNSTLPGCPPIEPLTLLSRAHAADLRVAMVVGKEKFCQLWQLDDFADGTDYRIDEADRAYVFARGGDGDVADQMIALLPDYEVIIVHFPNPDYFGHLSGWMSDQYLYELSNTDRQVGRVLAALDELGLTDETLVIVTADHGGTGTSHGQDTPADRTIPLIVAGPGVVSGTLLEGARALDVTPTALWALGLELPISDDPAVQVGVPLTEAFGLPAWSGE